jgi:hypothetical protein
MLTSSQNESAVGYVNLKVNLAYLGQGRMQVSPDE